MSSLLFQMFQDIDETAARRMEAVLLPWAESMLWGTYGKGAVEAYEDSGVPLPPVRHVRLGDCSTSHLEAIQRNLEGALELRPEFYRSYLFPHMAVELILASRKEKLCRSTWSSAKSRIREALSWPRTMWSMNARRLMR